MEMKAPLVGASLWSAQRTTNKITTNKPNSQYALPKYKISGHTNGNSASAALNKWLMSYVPEGCSIHSFHNSMRDRLRAINCPSEMTEQIGGWARLWELVSF